MKLISEGSIPKGRARGLTAVSGWLGLASLLLASGCWYAPVQGPVGLPLPQETFERRQTIEGKACVFYLFGLIPANPDIQPRIEPAIRDALLRADVQNGEFTLLTVERRRALYFVFGTQDCVFVTGLVTEAGDQARSGPAASTSTEPTEPGLEPVEPDSVEPDSVEPDSVEPDPAEGDSAEPLSTEPAA